jgi:hypothetical protein
MAHLSLHLDRCTPARKLTLNGARGRAALAPSFGDPTLTRFSPLICSVLLLSPEER